MSRFENVPMVDEVMTKLALTVQVIYLDLRIMKDEQKSGPYLIPT